MRQVAKLGTVYVSIVGALAVVVGVVFSPVFAADIIILRTLPEHNVLEQPLAENATSTVRVPTEQRELIQSLVPHSKMLNDGEFGSVLASPPPNGPGATGLQDDVLGYPIDPSGSALSSLPGMGMGQYGSLGGLGGEISGQVTGAVDNAMQGLSNALGGLGSQ